MSDISNQLNWQVGRNLVFQEKRKTILQRKLNLLLHLLLLILTILFIIWLLVIFLLRLIIGLFILILMPRKLLTFSTNVMFSTKDVEFETTIGLVQQSLTLTSVLYEGFPVISRHMSSLVEDIDEATIQCLGHPWLYIWIPSTLPSRMRTFRPLTPPK